MFVTGAARRPRRIGAFRATVRILTAALCLIAAFSSTSPVFCVERDGACAAGAAAPGPEDCHNRPGDVASCGSCTDVAAPEEAHFRSNHPGPGLELAAALPPAHRAPDSPLTGITPPPGFVRLAGPTPGFIRTTVLLI